jgi:hypothetical protein
MSSPSYWTGCAPRCDKAPNGATPRGRRIRLVVRGDNAVCALSREMLDVHSRVTSALEPGKAGLQFELRIAGLRDLLIVRRYEHRTTSIRHIAKYLHDQLRIPRVE